MSNEKVNPIWKYVATALGSFILALAISFGTGVMGGGNDLLEQKVDYNTKANQELRLTLVELNKSMVDLRIVIARWADASEKNRKSL